MQRVNRLLGRALGHRVGHAGNGNIYLGWDGGRSQGLDKLLQALSEQIDVLVAGWTAELSAGRVPDS